MMIMPNSEFPALEHVMQTPQKKSGIACKMSYSPNSDSTYDNSFEQEVRAYQDAQEEQDELFEYLLAYFDHKVLTPIQTDSQLYEQLDDIRHIFGPPEMSNYLYINHFMMVPPLQRSQYLDLTIYEQKILLDDRTTLMIKNIPKDVTPVRLQAELNTHFKFQYDFLYIPFDQQTNTNSGYGFVNFVSSKIVLLFYQKYNGQPWVKFHSDKVCVLRYAKQQGKRDIINQKQYS